MNVSSQASWAMKESKEAAEEESSQHFSVCQKHGKRRRGLRHDIYEHDLRPWPKAVRVLQVTWRPRPMIGLVLGLEKTVSDFAWCGCKV
jgi:hypothetical protein